MEERNVAALQSWGRADDLERKLRGLDEALAGAWALSEPGGRYARLVRRFERWADRVCEMEDARKDGTLQGEDIFIEPLGDAWEDEKNAVQQKLAACSRALEGLDTPMGAPGEMVDGTRRLVESMLGELSVMKGIQEAAMAREEHWIESMNREDDEVDTPRAGAAWRTL